MRAKENITSMFPGVGCSILLSKAITLFWRVERPVHPPQKRQPLMWLTRTPLLNRGILRTKEIGDSFSQ